MIQVIWKGRCGGIGVVLWVEGLGLMKVMYVEEEEVRLDFGRKAGAGAVEPEGDKNVAPLTQYSPGPCRFSER